MIRPKKRKRLTRKNNSLLQTLDISFEPRDGGTDVVAKYGKMVKGGKRFAISTRFNKVLEMEDMEQISDALFNGYTFRQFKKDCPELAESCEGWSRSKKVWGEEDGLD